MGNIAVALSRRSLTDERTREYATACDLVQRLHTGIGFATPQPSPSISIDISTTIRRNGVMPPIGAYRKLAAGRQNDATLNDNPMTIVRAIKRGDISHVGN